MLLFVAAAGLRLLAPRRVSRGLPVCTFVLNVALVASQCQHRPYVSVEHEAGKTARAFFQVFGKIRIRE